MMNRITSWIQCSSHLFGKRIPTDAWQQSNRAISIAAIAALGSFALVGCGGTIGSFDSYQPRDATIADFSGTSHAFSWLPLGNPLFSTVGPFRIDLSVIAEENTGTFELRELSGSFVAGGTYRWTPPTMALTVGSSTDTTKVPVGSIANNQLDADVADGRIRFRSLTSSVEVTSDPE